MGTGHIISQNSIPISLENVHSDYLDIDSRIEFRNTLGNTIYLYFPADGGVTMYWKASKVFRTPSAFRKEFPDIVQTIPVLGPIEHHEQIVTDKTINSAAGTTRASRHFRNYWLKNPDGFDDFQRLVEDTWPGMSVSKPEITPFPDDHVNMFVSENRVDRELYWAGLGFQIWCQLLTHISRCSESDLLIVDEPEVYLHPEVQRQLLGILRDVHPDILLATHSVEILGEADPSEILLVDKSQKSARRVRDVEGVQHALDKIGSIQNITLTELARNRRLVFVEGLNDYRILRRFAKILGYNELAAGSGMTALESGGFDSWSKVQALAWGFRNTIKSELSIAAIYDRDYRSDDESNSLKMSLEEEIKLAHFHQSKEIENYLLPPQVLERAAMKAIEERAHRTGLKSSLDFNIEEILESVTNKLKSTCQGQYISKYCAFFKSSGKDQATLASESLIIFDDKWSSMKSRLEVVPGKDVLRSVRDQFQKSHGISLTDFKIIDCYNVDEIPQDIKTLLVQLEKFRVSPRKA